MTVAFSEPRATPWTGAVVAYDAGVAIVRTAQGEVRATYSGRMLARVARDRSASVGAGDQVVLRWWPDGRVTIEDVLTSRGPIATVTVLRSR